MHLNWSVSSFLRLLQLLQQFVQILFPGEIQNEECSQVILFSGGGWTVGDMLSMDPPKWILFSSGIINVKSTQVEQSC